MYRKLISMTLLLAASGCHQSTVNDEPGGRPPGAPANAVSAAPSAVKVGTDPGHVGRGTPLTAQAGHGLAAFAAGCFWGVEDPFRPVPRVTAPAAGYSVGDQSNATHERISQHDTGYAQT